MNGVSLGNAVTSTSYNFTTNNADLYFGSYDGSYQLDAAVSEFKVYN